MKQRTYRIETMNVAELAGRLGGPRDRVMRQGTLFALGASLRDLGELGPVAVVNELTGAIVDGRARIRRLEDAGVETCTVAVVNLTPAQERAARVQLNAGGVWDADSLAETLEGIATADPELYERQRLDEIAMDLMILGAGIPPPHERPGQTDLF